jgi:hypothetical protein
MPDLHPSATHFKAVSPPLSPGHEPPDSRSDVCISSRSMLFPNAQAQKGRRNYLKETAAMIAIWGSKIVYADMDEVMRI